MKNHPAVAVGYVRVSTDEQHLGPEAQRHALERWACDNGAQLVAVHVDHGVSGAADLDKRPALLDALAAVREHAAGALVVAKRDRLARDPGLACAIERDCQRVGARVLAADGVGNGDTPEAEMMRGIQDVLARYERKIIAARTKAALAAKKRRGELVGSVPYGFRVAPDGVHLEEHPAEQQMIALIACYRAEGLSLRKIGQRLSAAGLYPRNGKAWNPKTLRSIALAAAA